MDWKTLNLWSLKKGKEDWAEEQPSHLSRISDLTVSEWDLSFPEIANPRFFGEPIQSRKLLPYWEAEVLFQTPYPTYYTQFVTA